MSILIKGISMPIMPKEVEQGGKIPYIDVRIFADGSAVTSKGEKPYYTEYSAAEIPPHGRLIDADVFEKANAYFWGMGFLGAKSEECLCDLVNDAPTIIDEEDEHGEEKR